MIDDSNSVHFQRNGNLYLIIVFSSAFFFCGVPLYLLFLGRTEAVIMLLAFLAIGIAGVVFGMYRFLDKSVHLSIHPTLGIWTKKLGTVSWNDIEKIYITGDLEPESNRKYLHIYLKLPDGKISSEPDQNMYITEFKNKNKVQDLIDQYAKR